MQYHQPRGYICRYAVIIQRGTVSENLGVPLIESSQVIQCELDFYNNSITYPAAEPSNTLQFLVEIATTMVTNCPNVVDFLNHL